MTGAALTLARSRPQMLMQIGGRGFREPSQPGAGGEQYSNFGRDVLIGLLMERDREISALKRQLREAGLVITRDGADLQGSLKASGRDAKSSTRSAKTQTNKTVASTSNGTRPAVPKLKLAFGAKPPSRPPPARPHFGSARATTRKGKSVSVTGARARPPQSARIRVVHRNAQTPRAPGSARKSRPHRSPSPARKPTRGHRSDRKAAAARLRKKTEKALAALKVGSRANFDGHVGTVRFMGLVHFGARVWCGLELDRRVGNHNGVFKGKRYFKCKAGHGVLVLADKVSSVAKTMRVTPLQAKAPRTKSSRATKASNKPRSSLKL